MTSENFFMLKENLPVAAAMTAPAGLGFYEWELMVNEMELKQPESKVGFLPVAMQFPKKETGPVSIQDGSLKTHKQLK